MKKILIQESDEGIIYRYDKIPSPMFEFIILKGQRYKDRTHKYTLYVNFQSAPMSKAWKLAVIRGHKTDAIRKLDEIIRTYK